MRPVRWMQPLRRPLRILAKIRSIRSWFLCDGAARGVRGLAPSTRSIAPFRGFAAYNCHSFVVHPNPFQTPMYPVPPHGPYGPLHSNFLRIHINLVDLPNLCAPGYLPRIGAPCRHVLSTYAHLPTNSPVGPEVIRVRLELIVVRSELLSGQCLVVPG